MTRHTAQATAAFCLLAAAAPVQAQTLWDLSEPNISIGVLKPDPQVRDELTFLSAMYELAMRIPINARIAVVGDVPFAHFAENHSSNNGIGNPYFGLVAQAVEEDGASAEGEIGIRPPLAKSGPYQVVGLLADFDRLEMFLDRYLTLQGAIKLRLHAEKGAILAMRLAPRRVIYIGDENPLLTSRTYLGYGTYVGFDNGRTRILVGVTGVYDGDGVGDIGNRTVNQLSLDVGRWMGSVRPGFRFCHPLGLNLDRSLSAVYGLNLSFRLVQP